MKFTKPWRVHYARTRIVSSGPSNVWGAQTWKSVSPNTTQSNTVHNISMLISTHTSQNISVTFSLAILQVINSSQEVNCKLSKAAETRIYNAFLTSPTFYHNVYKAFYTYACVLAGTFFQSNSQYIQNSKMFLNQNAASLGSEPINL